MEAFRIDEIARKLRESLPPAIHSVQKDLESNFRAVLRSTLGKLDLVTREEFDTQTKVLERTRARLEQLEARVEALEGGAGSGTGRADTGGADTPPL
jgi:ubiquinone biosynthesis accessory factor UbiK